ncbi:hypothetical protein N656DRAFT_350806 [Canariomyces notabilis]|uniref:Uncharacterized protein n=1 Tax=Canariomyces notabilis TaxID=2074819 RepID=A0AAN6QFK8_9PEZI|nr:hypothetical protein N656DRAFT_350806 [Canariomyces arenarius]
MLRFRETPNTIVRTILQTQFPERLLRFAIPCYSSTGPDLDRGDFEKKRQAELRAMIEYLKQHPPRRRLKSRIYRGILPPSYVTLAPDFGTGDLERINLFLQENFGVGGGSLYEKTPAAFIGPEPIDMDLASVLSKTQNILDYFTNDFLRETLPFARNHFALQRTVASADEIPTLPTIASLQHT